MDTAHIIAGYAPVAVLTFATIVLNARRSYWGWATGAAAALANAAAAVLVLDIPTAQLAAVTASTFWAFAAGGQAWKASTAHVETRIAEQRQALAGEQDKLDVSASEMERQRKALADCAAVLHQTALHYAHRDAETQG